MVFLLQWIQDLDEFLENQSDKRVKEWFLMDGIWSVIWTNVIYLIIVKFLGPMLMQYRQPYSLKNTIIAYNILQVTVCSIVTFWILNTKITFGCAPLESLDPELTMKVFFVLRKKQNQVSILHLYHHVTTFCFVWAATKIFPSTMVLFPIGLNCFIHVLMYTYYLMSAIGSPEIQDKILKFKRYLTIIQMTQFCCLVIYTVQLLSPNCNVPSFYGYTFIPNTFVVFYLFYRFYQEAYLENQKNN